MLFSFSGVAGAVFRIAGEMLRLPAYFDNPELSMKPFAGIVIIK